MNKPTNSFNQYRYRALNHDNDDAPSSWLKDTAHLKRFFERINGDKNFLQRLLNNPEKRVQIVRECGSHIDPDFLASILSNNGELLENPSQILDNPLMKPWNDWIESIQQSVLSIRQQGDTPDFPRFNGWRKRQIARCESQLGRRHNNNLIHSLFAFELSQGCSVGCTMCGLAAKKLQGNYKYTANNAKLWRAIIQKGVDIFGLDSCQSNACYWATEPLDNPGYSSFLDDLRQITGAMPQTTTAVPLRNIELTKKVMAMQRQYGGFMPRFSVQTLPQLLRIHEAFTPEELAHVELLLFMNTSLISKVQSGKLRNPNSAGEMEGLEGSTIACVSGFLVNMVTKSVRLITPCPTSDDWPLGYRTLGAGQFHDAQSYHDLLIKLCDEHMPTNVANDRIVRFRDDLLYQPRADGFVLSSKFQESVLDDKPFLAKMGSMIAQKQHTAKEVIAALTKGGDDIIAIVATLHHLFETALLDDTVGASET